MKKQFFDILETIPGNIDDSTIKPEIEISSEQVKAGVLRRLSSDSAVVKTKKKFTSKKLGITLIAAALAAGVLGTFTVGAMGGFNEVFGGFFAGQKTGGVYSGGNVKIQNNEKYKVSLLGVTGDENNAYASLTIENADGSAFTENPNTDYIHNYFVDYDPDDEYSYGLVGGPSEFSGFTGSVSIKVPLITKIKTGGCSGMDYVNEGGEIYYGFVNENTIRCIPMYYNNDGADRINLKGEEMKVEEKELYIYHNVEDICECVLVYPKNDDEVLDTKPLEEANAKIRDVKKNLKEGQVVVFRYDEIKGNEQGNLTTKATYSVAEVKKIDLDMTGSWRLNYQNEESIDIPVYSKTIEHKGLNDLGTFSYTINSLKVSPFSAQLDIQADKAEIAEKSTESENQSNFEISVSDFVITLLSGEKVECICQSDLNNGKTYEETKGNFKFEFYYTIDDQRMIINPEEIKFIEIDGIKIMEK